MLRPVICFIALFVESKYIENELVRFIFRSEVQFTFVIGELIDEAFDKSDKLTALSSETARLKRKISASLWIEYFNACNRVYSNWGGLVEN